jgi:hypothetical protein
MPLQAENNLCSVDGVPKERMTLAVAGEVHKLFASVCKGRSVGRSMNDTATRIIAWFCRQEPLIQTAIANDVDAGMEHAYAAALEALAAELRGRAKPANAAKVPDEGLVIVHPPEQASQQRRRPRGREQS